MFASKISTTLGIISMILISLYTIKADADTCSDVKAKSETARISAENACAKAAKIAINSAEPTKAVAKKACDDAKIIAKNVADKAAAAVCPLETSTQLQQNVSSEAAAVEAQTKSLPEILKVTTDSVVESEACISVKAKSETARISAENACAKAAQVAINSAAPTKAVAKKACDDAKIIAKNVADKAAATVCPAPSIKSYQNVSEVVVGAQTKPLPEVAVTPKNSNAESAACTGVKAKSEAARVSAEQACAKAAQVAINSAAPTKAIAKKACDDAKIIAKNVADKAAAAVCPAPSMYPNQNVSDVVGVTKTNSNVESEACSNVKAKSEAARVSAENACAKAAQVAINSAAPTKAIAKKACDDAKIIAKNVADKAAAAVCPATTTTITTIQSNQQILEAQKKHALTLIRKILIFLRMV